eukprot:1161891-Pelagomonas_calceolata.AAC.7
MADKFTECLEAEECFCPAGLLASEIWLVKVPLPVACCSCKFWHERTHTQHTHTSMYACRGSTVGRCRGPRSTKAAAAAAAAAGAAGASTTAETAGWWWQEWGQEKGPSGLSRDPAHDQKVLWLVHVVSSMHLHCRVFAVQKVSALELVCWISACLGRQGLLQVCRLWGEVVS